MKLIGLTGRAGSGKDTVAGFLCQDHGFVQIALADPLRDGLKAMLGLTDEQLHRRDLKEERIGWLGRSPRELLQTLGTEWGRQHVAPDLWLRVAEQRIQRIKASPPCLHVAGIVISDIRFENEAEWLRAMGGEVWFIDRPAQRLDGPTGQHCSERQILRLDGDIAIANTGTITDLEELVGQTILEAQES